MNQHPAQSLLVLNTYFCRSCSKHLWPGDIHSQKEQDDGNLRAKPKSRKSDRRNSLHWVFQLPKPAEAEPLFWEQRINGAWAKSYYSPFMSYTEFPKENTWEPLPVLSKPGIQHHLLPAELLQHLWVLPGVLQCLPSSFQLRLPVHPCSCINQHFPGTKRD